MQHSANAEAFGLSIQGFNQFFSVLAIHSFSNEISQDYQIEVEFYSDILIEFKLSHPLSLHFYSHPTFFLSGYALKTEIHTDYHINQLHYKITLGSFLHRLKTNFLPRVFVNNTLCEIVNSIMEANHIASNQYQWLTKSNNEKMPMVIKKEESDYDFLLRQLTCLNLAFTFNHLESGAKLLIFSALDYKDLPFKILSLPYLEAKGQNKYEPHIFDIKPKALALPSTIVLNNYNPEIPSLNLEVPTLDNSKSPHQHHIYGLNYNTIEKGQKLLASFQQGLESHRHQLLIKTTYPEVSPGQCLFIQNARFLI